jgi:hypothetical protein
VIFGLVLVAVMIIGYILLSKKSDALAATINQRLDIERQIADSIGKWRAFCRYGDERFQPAKMLPKLFLSNLPSDWLVRNLSVNNKRVEYAVRLPDGLALPNRQMTHLQGSEKQLRAERSRKTCIIATVVMACSPRMFTRKGRCRIYGDATTIIDMCLTKPELHLHFLESRARQYLK